MKQVLKLLFVFLTANILLKNSIAQTVTMTPVTKYLGGLNAKKIVVPQKFQLLLDSNRILNVPSGFDPHLFYMGGLTKPRVLEISPDGILHVIDFKPNGAVYSLPDLNTDNVADTLLPVVTGVNAHDFKFYSGDIYVAEENRILRCQDLNHDGFFETKITFIDSVGLHSNNPVGGHKSRTIVFDSLNQKIYVSIGSSCNVCRDEERAVIEQYNIDGTGRRIYASGIRNAVGMTIHPKTGKLWANNNGSDKQGNDIPPEWIDPVHENGFYGFPFAYANQVWFNMDAHPDYAALKPITKTDSSNVASMKEPAALIQAHSAPMELEFVDLSSDMLLNNGFLMALRGSWNRSPATGYKLVFLSQNSNWSNIYSVSDFVSGFLTDSIAKTFWGRPVGLAIDNLKNIYLSSDEGNKFILKLKNTRPIGMNITNKVKFNISPNPFINTLHFNQILPNSSEISLFDLTGKEQYFEWDKLQNQMKVSGLPDGIYILQVKTPDGIFTQKLIHNNEE